MDARNPTRRKTPRLAYCEYVSPDTDASSQVWLARLLLIETAKRVHPGFLETLSNGVFPFYRKLAKKGYDFDKILWSASVSPYDALTTEGGLKSALAKWAAEFNAEAAWLKDGALRTLRDWYVAPDWRKSLRWHAIHGHSDTAPTGEAFEFRFMEWNTELFTWARYSELLRRLFEKTLLEYERKTRKLAESCGLVRATQKYSPDNFDWFVLYQFAGLSSTKIAADEWSSEHSACLDNSTVRKGIKAAAKLIGWDHLRAPQRSRNRKIR